MKPTHIIFEGKRKAGVVDLPERPNITLTCDVGCNGHCGDYCPIIHDNKIKLENYEQHLKQALANPIFFKDEKDEEKISYEIYIRQEDRNKHFTEWQPEPDKPYTIPEGVEIKEDWFKENIEGLGGNGLATTSKKFAFIVDTGARLPEKKEQPFLIACNGIIGMNGICNKCFQYSQSSSNYCGRMVEQDVFTEEINRK